MSLMGIDIGTTSSKVMVFSRKGDLLAAHREAYALITNERRHCVLDPDEVWRAVATCIRCCGGEEVRADPVSALAVSSQGEAVVPLDRRGAILAHAPVSADARGEEFLEAAAANPGADYLFRTTGQVVDPIHTLFKILWWKRYRPELYERTWKFLTFDGFALMRLGLPPLIEASMAARTMCFDVPDRCWSETIHRTFGLDSDKMPAVIESGRAVGTLDARVAAELGLAAAVTVVPGGHDQPCGAVGAGIHHSGVVYSIGTTECLTFVTEAPHGASRRDAAPERLPRFPVYPHVLAGHRVTLAGSLTGGALFSWLRDKVIRDPDPDALFAVEQRIGSRYTTEVLFLAHLAGSGLYYGNPESRAIIHGLDLNTGLEDIVKAAQEGITFEQYLSFTALEERCGEPDTIIAVGGGTRSRTWMQVKADIFQAPIETPALPDAAVLGAAVLAGLGSGVFSDPRAAIEAMVDSGETYYPRADMQPYYAHKLERYQALYERNH